MKHYNKALLSTAIFVALNATTAHAAVQTAAQKLAANQVKQANAIKAAKSAIPVNANGINIGNKDLDIRISKIESSNAIGLAKRNETKIANINSKLGKISIAEIKNINKNAKAIDVINDPNTGLVKEVKDNLDSLNKIHNSVYDPNTGLATKASEAKVNVIDGRLTTAEKNVNSSYERIKANIEAIVKTDDRASKLKKHVESNDKKIATNTKGINDTKAKVATNTQGINDAKALVATNTQGITDTKALVATNTQGIKDTNAKVTTNTQGITDTKALVATNTQGIADTKAKVATNTQGIADTKAKVATNTQGIKDLDPRVKANKKANEVTQREVDKHHKMITDNKSVITNHTGSLKTVANLAVDNTIRAAANAKGLAKNSHHIDQIATATGVKLKNTNQHVALAVNHMAKQDTVITSHSKKIESNTRSIKGNTTTIIHNTQTIQYNTKNITSNTTDIKSNSKHIATNTQGIKRNSNRIDNNSQRIDKLENTFIDMSKQIDSVGAMAVATSQLMQPYNVGHAAVMVGVGHYGQSNAIALGMGVRVTEQLALKASVSANDLTENLAAGAGMMYEF